MCTQPWVWKQPLALLYRLEQERKSRKVGISPQSQELQNPLSRESERERREEALGPPNLVSKVTTKETQSQVLHGER